MQAIETSGLVKSNKEPLKVVTPDLETDNVCEIGFSLSLSRTDYLRLVRAKNLEHTVVLKIAIPQQELGLSEEVDGVVTVEATTTELVPVGVE